MLLHGTSQQLLAVGSVLGTSQLPRHRQAARGNVCQQPCQALIPSASIPGLPQSCTGQLQTEEEKELKPGARSMFTARGAVQKNPRDCALLVIPGSVSQGTCPGLGKCGNTSVGQEENKGRWITPASAVPAQQGQRGTGKPPGDTELSVTAEERARGGGSTQRGDGHPECPWSCTCSSPQPGAAQRSSWMEHLPCQDQHCPRTVTGPRNNDLQDDFQIISIRTQRFAQEVQSGSEQKLFSFAFRA